MRAGEPPVKTNPHLYVGVMQVRDGSLAYQKINELRERTVNRGPHHTTWRWRSYSWSLRQGTASDASAEFDRFLAIHTGWGFLGSSSSSSRMTAAPCRSGA